MNWTEKTIPEDRLQKYQEHEGLCCQLIQDYRKLGENSGEAFTSMFRTWGVSGALHQLEYCWDRSEMSLLSSTPSGEDLVKLADTAIKTLVCIKGNETYSQRSLDLLQSDICFQIAKLYPTKNENYNDSFGKTVQRYGPISALTRMSDKWNRIVALLSGGTDKVGETVEDTLLDLADYALMTVVELRRYKRRKQGPSDFEAISK